MRVLGIDLSLNATGLAMLSLDENSPINLPHPENYPYMAKKLAAVDYEGVCISPVPAGVLERWEAILVMVLAWAQHANTVVIEGYSFGSFTAYSTAIREIGGIVRYHLLKMGQTPIEVAPAAVKKFATGSGRTGKSKYAAAGISKDQVLTAVHHSFGLELFDHNMADAFVLAKIGEAMGCSDASNARLPYHQREVIGALKYPSPKVRTLPGRKLKFNKPVQPRLGEIR